MVKAIGAFCAIDKPGNDMLFYFHKKKWMDALMDGVVFHIQRFSLFDGPGVRTVVFLKGCPLQCKWCHNPEGIALRPQLMYAADQCIGCGACVQVCPQMCHTLLDGFHRFQRDGCIDCGACAQVCCSKALSVAGQRMSTAQVMEEVLRDASLFRDSGGGMTLSGGEPLFQSEFSIDLLRQAKLAGLHTCIETSGFCSPEVIREAAEYLDLILFDYKATGEELHHSLCGVSNQRILENLNLLDTLAVRTVLRCPIVPGLNDQPEHIEAIAGLAKQYACIEAVHLEPYHRMGLSKAAQLGMVQEYDGQPPERERIETFRCRIEDCSGKETRIS